MCYENVTSILTPSRDSDVVHQIAYVGTDLIEKLT